MENESKYGTFIEITGDVKLKEPDYSYAESEHNHNILYCKDGDFCRHCDADDYIVTREFPCNGYGPYCKHIDCLKKEDEIMAEVISLLGKSLAMTEIAINTKFANETHPGIR